MRFALVAVLCLSCCVGVHGENFQFQPGTSPIVEGFTRASNVFRKLLMPKPQLEPRNVKLFVASLPRTGTASLEAALEKLGYSAMHGAEYVDHIQAVEDLYEGRKSVDELFHYMGNAGFDVAGMDLMHHYWRWAAGRNMKVILTTRDVEKWIKSLEMLSGLDDILASPPFSLFKKLRQTQNLLHDVLRVNITGGDSRYWDHEVLKSGYERHFHEVSSTIDPSNLLIFDVRDGWEPLCEFLGVPVPSEPFPHVNDGKALKVALRVVAAVVWLWPFLAALPLVLAVCCWTALASRRRSKPVKGSKRE